MFKSLFGGKKKVGKSVNEVRGRPKRTQTVTDPLEERIKARRARSLCIAEAKAAFSAAGRGAQPDIAGAVDAAKNAIQGATLTACRSEVDRALVLKGSERVIGETLSHPLRQYLALAVVRGLLEEGQEQGVSAGLAPQKRRKTQRKPGSP